MAIFHTFCFAFSLRLGAIIIAAVTLVKCSVTLTVSLLALENFNDFTHKLHAALGKQQLFQPLFKAILLFEELEYYLIAVIVFYSLLIVSCILLLMGAYQCKPAFVYPFLSLYIIYLVVLFFNIMVLYLTMITDDDGLEIIIIYDTLAFFFFLYCIYSWFCVYSLVKIIKALQKRCIVRSRKDYPKQGLQKIK